jgi:ribosome recycling factor
VDYYGAMTPLKTMANASTPDAQTISIQPFDKRRDQLPACCVRA